MDNLEKYIQESAQKLEIIIPEEIVLKSKKYYHILIGFYHYVGHQNGIKISTWSMLRVLDFKERPHPELKRLVFDELQEPIYEELPSNPTWLEIWQAADKLIIASGDEHHSFIENIDVTNGDGNLWLGS